MKNILLIALALVVAVPAIAQKKKKKEEVKIETPAFNYDEKTNLISYNNVVETKGTTAELYAKSLSWMKSYYKNPIDVIRTKDAEGGKLEGKARFRIWDEKEGTGTKTAAGSIEYNITIICKDGRYKYTVTKIGKKQSTFYPAEKWDTANKAEYKRMYASYLVQLDAEINKIIESMNSAITAGEEAKEEEW
ncbi:MAG: DUF4468 domain-containing protein [Flavobacteriales bacterium]|nr:DUF4468 domain-containing protein [Flavobacteriales bacterium]